MIDRIKVLTADEMYWIDKAKGDDLFYNTIVEFCNQRIYELLEFCSEHNEEVIIENNFTNAFRALSFDEGRGELKEIYPKLTQMRYLRGEDGDNN